MVSPLSPASHITNHNAFYVMANATLQTQLEKMLEYICEQDPHASFTVVVRTEKENEVKIAAEFKHAYENLRSAFPDISYREVYSGSGISSGIQLKGNYVFIASNEELFVNSLLRDLSVFSRSGDVTLLGLASILNFESVPLDYFETLHLHFPTAYWTDDESQRMKAFRNNFYNRYEVPPSEYACRGYDLTLYFGGLLLAYGPSLSQGFEKSNLLRDYMLGDFQFLPCKADGEIKFYENQNISVIKYEEYKFVKVK
jgi:hypothetical protein